MTFIILTPNEFIFSHAFSLKFKLHALLPAFFNWVCKVIALYGHAGLLYDGQSSAHYALLKSIMAIKDHNCVVEPRNQGEA